MPRTIAVDCPGCPPIRALTFDVLGLIKVIEARSSATNPISTPKVVERWGQPDASRSILTASLIDREFNPQTKGPSTLSKLTAEEAEHRALQQAVLQEWHMLSKDRRTAAAH